MGIILWIVFGAIVGWLASIIMKTNNQQGPLLDIIVGVVGAVAGGWIMSLFGQGGVSGFNLYSFVVALIGAVVLIAIVKAVRRTA
ncbi:MAG: transglycosylase [Parcubacteria group bacterium]|nr:transglycosylase [Parcubacteria group bacterium]